MQHPDRVKLANVTMQTMTTQESTKKRLHDGQLKLQAPLDVGEIVDLTHISADESFSSSKRTKASTIILESEAPPFLPSYPQSQGQPKSDKIFTKKKQKPPLFKSPSWQRENITFGLGGAEPPTSPLPITVKSELAVTTPLQAQAEAYEDPFKKYEDPFKNRSKIRTRSSTATYTSHASRTPDPPKSPLLAELRKAGITEHPRLPSRPKVIVEIAKPDHHSAGSASRTLLDKFKKPLPRSDADQTARHSEAYVLAELKKDTSITRSRASTVEAIFPYHGLSRHYDDDATIKQRKSVVQPKVRKVNRSKVRLDRGISQPATAFDPTNVISPREQARRILDAKFEDATNGALLTFYNDRNDRQIDGKFQFVDSYIYRAAVPKMNSGPSDVGCMCFKQCDPTDTACQCLRLQMSDVHLPAPYVVRQGGLVLLNPDFINCAEDTPKEIYECNDVCSCSKDCFNRIVQKGRTIPLQIFMTKNCGFGIRSPQTIKKGQFIDVYLGELLTTKAIEEYELATTEQSSSYVFSLDYFHDSASYHIQGLHFGSPTRFINHSCNPNARTFTVMMNHADQKIYKLAYFAIKDIPAMKEITFDYSPDTANEDSLLPTQDEVEEGVVRCLCGERRCRGRIWPKRQMAKSRGPRYTRT